MYRYFVAVVALVGLSVGLVGCGGGAGGRSDLVRAKGKVVYKGQPVAGATVVFTPTDKGSPANGTTDSGGVFTLSTGGRPGATPGVHKVTVTKVTAGGPAKTLTPDDMMKMQKAGGGIAKLEGRKSEIPEKYSTAKTDLQATVTTDPAKNDFEFNLVD